MIKTSVYGYPLFYQNDNTYSLPAFTGAVQWNGTVKKMQVSNGSMWCDIDNQVNFNVDSRLQPILEWAEKKIREEKELEEKAKNNTTLADLLQQRKKIEDQITTVGILSK